MEDIKTNLLDSFHLIIPTKNRHQNFNTIFKYYQHSGIKVSICDGSDKPYSLPVDSSNISYKYYGPTNFSKKLMEVFLTIDEKYSCLCGDDDLTTPTGIKKSLEFLEKNKDYSSVQGIYLESKENQKNQFYFKHRKNIGVDIGSNRVEKRLNSWLSNYFPVFYAIHRTEVFKDIFTADIKDVKSLNLLEIIMGYMTIISGKHKVLPILYGIRQDSNDSARHKMKLQEFIDFNNPDHFTKLFLKKVCIYLEKKEGISPDQGEKIIQKSYELSENFNPNFKTPLFNNITKPLKIRFWERKKIQLINDLKATSQYQMEMSKIQTLRK